MFKMCGESAVKNAKSAEKVRRKTQIVRQTCGEKHKLCGKSAVKNANSIPMSLCPIEIMSIIPRDKIISTWALIIFNYERCEVRSLGINYFYPSALPLIMRFVLLYARTKPFILWLNLWGLHVQNLAVMIVDTSCGIDAPYKLASSTIADTGSIKYKLRETIRD